MINRSNIISNAVAIVAISIAACDKDQQIVTVVEAIPNQSQAAPQFRGIQPASREGIVFDTIHLRSVGRSSKHYKISSNISGVQYRPETPDRRSEIQLIPNGMGDGAGGEITMLMSDAIADPPNSAGITFRAERAPGGGRGRAYVIQANASGTEQLYPLWIDMKGGEPQFVFHTDGSNESMGPLILREGSPELPALTFKGDPDTGLLRNGVNTISVSAGGDVVLDISPNGLNVYDWLSHRGNRLGFYGSWPTAKPTNVPVTIEGVHAALVSLGLIQ